MVGATTIINGTRVQDQYSNKLSPLSIAYRRDSQRFVPPLHLIITFGPRVSYQNKIWKDIIIQIWKTSKIMMKNKEKTRKSSEKEWERGEVPCSSHTRSHGPYYEVPSTETSWEWCEHRKSMGNKTRSAPNIQSDGNQSSKYGIIGSGTSQIISHMKDPFPPYAQFET